MTLHLNKLLCIGGEENGKHIENKGFHQIFKDGMFLEPETYEPKYLYNSVTKQNELYYVLNDLSEAEANEQLMKLLISDKNT